MLLLMMVLLQNYIFQQQPDIQLKRLPSVADAFLALTTGRGDAFVTAYNNRKTFF